MILITEFMDESARQWLEMRTPVIYDPDLYRQPERLLKLLPQAEGLIVRNRTRVNAKCLQTAPNLQVVGRLGVGLDNLDIDALASRRLNTVFAPGSSANAVAEFCLMLMLALVKRLMQADGSVRQGLWEREKLTGNELNGKILGIVGLGMVGQRLAELAQHMGCHVIAHTMGDSRGIPSVSLPFLLANSDFISLNVPLTPQTNGMIGYKELKMMKPTAFLINAARGGVVDEDALFEVLSTAGIAGAALDVRLQEPPADDDRFNTLDNVILTPHLAGLTEEAQRAVCQTVAEDVWRVLQREVPVYPVPGLCFFPQCCAFTASSGR